MQIQFEQVKQYATETEFKMPILVDLKRIVQVDEDPDLSYLEDDDNEYKEENMQRLREYGETWHMIGLQVKATVMVPISKGCFHTHELTSGGLWGIESDSDPAHLSDIEGDEWYTLQKELELMNVYIPNEIEVQH